jgi:hypothetical protein
MVWFVGEGVGWRIVHSIGKFAASETCVSIASLSSMGLNMLCV